jgi:hypothetical protein
MSRSTRARYCTSSGHFDLILYISRVPYQIKPEREPELLDAKATNLIAKLIPGHHLTRNLDRNFFIDSGFGLGPISDDSPFFYTSVELVLTR